MKALDARLNRLLDTVGDVFIRGSKMGKRWTVGIGRHMGVTYESFDHEGQGDTIDEAIRAMVTSMEESARREVADRRTSLAIREADTESLLARLAELDGGDDNADA